MKPVKRILITAVMAAVMVSGMSDTVNAAACGEWEINYSPGAPSSAGNQISEITLDYYGGGYCAVLNSISGADGVKITSSSAGGMETVILTSSERTKTWTMKRSTAGSVTFRITIEGDGPARAAGRICINK